MYILHEDVAVPEARCGSFFLKLLSSSAQWLLIYWLSVGNNLCMVLAFCKLSFPLAVYGSLRIVSGTLGNQTLRRTARDLSRSCRPTSSFLMKPL